jgi:c-di-GMP-binding flagellar brake protein YcgR
MLLSINEMVFIEKIDEENIKYKTRVADIQSDYFSVEVPINIKMGTFKRLKDGEKVAVSYVGEGGIQFQFFSTVIRSSTENILTFHLQKPEPKSIKKIQRREYLRVPLNVNLSIEHHGSKLMITSKDISGGGVSFVDHQHRFAEQDQVSGEVIIKFKNGKQKNVLFRGTVTRMTPINNEVKVAVIEFTEINEVQRNYIIRFCFERQLELHKKFS